MCVCVCGCVCVWVRVCVLKKTAAFAGSCNTDSIELPCGLEKACACRCGRLSPQEGWGGVGWGDAGCGGNSWRGWVHHSWMELGMEGVGA